MNINKVAIIIVNWNGVNLLKECLTSIDKQSYSDFKVIIVDNGSTDSSCDYIQSHHPHYTILRQSTNMGFAEGNNIGIRLALTDPSIQYIVLINNDTVTDENWLQELMSATHLYKNAMSFAPRIMKYYSRDEIDSAGLLLHSSGRVTNNLNGLPGSSGPIAKQVFGPTGACVMFRREFFEIVGLFDNRLFAYYEDVDLAWRGVQHNLICMYIPSSIIKHKIGSTSKKKKRFQTLSYRNRLIINYKNLTSTFIKKHFFPFFAFEVFMFFIALLSGHIAAYFQFFREIPKYKNDRRLANQHKI